LAALVGLGALGVLAYRMAEQRRAPGQASNPSALQERPALDVTQIPGADEKPPSAAGPEASATLGSGTALGGRPPNAAGESLSAEIRILDEVRAALDARRSAAAERALDRYAQRFPHGHLKPEATVLRLALLVRQGNRAAAQSLGARLLASASYKTYGHRIRALLREAGE
jgi:TolA-binding protein